MKRRIIWLVVSCLVVLSLLAASCAKAEAPTAKETAPAAKETAPAAKETAPAAKETTPAAKETTAAETEKPKYGGTLVYASRAAIVSWDDGDVAGWGGASYLCITNETPLQPDWTKGPAGSSEASMVNVSFITPNLWTGNLAESYEIPDDHTIIFHVRPGIHWALDPNSAASKLVGGRELTADDFVWNFRRIFMEIKTTTGYSTAGAESRVQDVYATDKYTVVVKTLPGQAGRDWEYMGAHSSYGRQMAPEVFKKYGNLSDWRNNVGTGPYMVKDHIQNASTTWVRNPNYWMTNPVGPGKGDQLPYPDTFRYLTIVDLSTRAAALRTGKIDIDAIPYSLDDAKQLKKTAPQLKSIRKLGQYMAVATRLDKPELPWAPQFDPNALKVRRAMNMAVNKQEILDNIYGGEGEVFNFEINSLDIWKDVYLPLDQIPASTRELWEYKPDKAKQLMVEAGYPDGFKTELIVNSATPDRVDTSSMLKVYWAKIGIDLSIKVVDPSVQAQYMGNHAYPELFFHGHMSDHAQPMYMVRTGNLFNCSNVDDPKFADYYNQMSYAYFDMPKRFAIMREYWLYTLDQALYTYLPAGWTHYFWQPWLKNYHGEILGAIDPAIAVKYVWIDQELKKSMGH